jgi:RNA polymerase sigma-70 factor (ECF subfamily)
MSETPGSARYGAVALSSEAQNRFVSENMRRVFLLIYRIVGNVADAQDLTQEAFIKALQRQDQLRDLDKAAHWLSRIATNAAIDFLRRSGRMNFAELDDMPEPIAVSASDTPERERMALLLRDVEDLPAEAVAEHLNCSKATVRSHIANARVKMRKHFERLQRRGLA